MRKTQLALSDILSKKVRVTIYGAFFFCAGVAATPTVFAQHNNTGEEQASESSDEASYKQPPRVYEVKSADKNSVATEESDDPVRNALKSVFKETAPERIKENARPPVKKSAKAAFTGVADYYADRFHGRKTASGQLHDKTKMTAAHLSLPFGTKVKVVSRHTGKSCVVTVNDRGPYTKNKIIDLSFAAAKELGLVTAGSRLVDCYLIEPE